MGRGKGSEERQGNEYDAINVNVERANTMILGVDVEGVTEQVREGDKHRLESSLKFRGGGASLN